MISAQISAIQTADRRHLWHPYTPMDRWRADGPPPVVVSARGPVLTLADGRQLLDGNSSWWVSTLGHNPVRLVEALKRQAEVLCHVSLGGLTHGPAALLAEELAAVAPAGLSTAFFSDDGSTAIESAVKMAAQYQRRTGHPERRAFAALGDGFHGETVGATSLGGVEIFRRPFASVLFPVHHLPVPVSPAELPAALAALAAFEDRVGRELAAVVVEPILQGAAGMRLYPPAYLEAVRQLCNRCGALLIADEVFTGYGRLGAMWGCGLAEVVPDVLCVAKGFTAGILPMAATLVSDPVLAAFDGGRQRAFLYGHSYAGNPLGAAVAREVLAIYRDEDVVGGVAQRARHIAAAFAAIGADPLLRGMVVDTRSLGAVGAATLAGRSLPTATVAALETTADLQGTGYAAPLGWAVYEEAFERGAYLRPLGEVVYVAPALNIDLGALDRLLAILHESLRAVAGRLT